MRYMPGAIHTISPQQTPPIFQSCVSLPSAAPISSSKEARGRRNRRRCWRSRLRSKGQLSWPGIYQVPVDSKSSLLGCTWRLRKSQGQGRWWSSTRWGIGWNSKFCSVYSARRFANIATILRASSWRLKWCNILLPYLPTNFLAVCLFDEGRKLATAGILPCQNWWHLGCSRPTGEPRFHTAYPQHQVRSNLWGPADHHRIS